MDDDVASINRRALPHVGDLAALRAVAGRRAELEMADLRRIARRLVVAVQVEFESKV